MNKIALNKETLENRLGVCIGSSDWMTIRQDQINLFAEATGDWDWVHVDAERAKAQTPFGGTIAQGFLVLSLTFQLLWEILDFSSVTFGLNYGLDKVRFISPVRVGSQIRMHVTPREVVERSSSEVRFTLGCEMEIKGQSRPAMIAELLLLIKV